MGRLSRMLWSLRSRLGLSPMQLLFRDLRSKGVVPERLRALEVFGGSGTSHLRDYADQVASLEAWEKKPDRAALLHRNFPLSTVVVTDSYAEVARATQRYDVIVIDNPEGKHGEHYEHFDLFPAVLRLAKDPAILVLNIRPGLGAAARDRTDRFDEGHLTRRRSFYGTEHVEQIPVTAMVNVYRKLLRAASFEVEWHIVRKRTRSGRLHYLALKIRRLHRT